MWQKKKKAEEEEQKNVKNYDITTEDQSAGSGAKTFIPADEKTSEEMEQELSEYIREDHSPKKKKRLHKKWSKKRKIITAVVGVLFIMIIIKSTSGKKEFIPPVSAIPLAKGSVTASLTLNGPVSGTESADVVSNLHAEVISINVKEGDRVEKGQILAIIDSEDTQKAVDMAQNTYDLAVSEYNENIRNTQNNYEKAVQDFNTAKLNYSRNKVLFDAGDISSADLEAAGNTMNDARRAVESFTLVNGKAMPDKSYELKVKSAQFELDQKKTDLDNTKVTSPITGTVVRVNSKVGQFADKPEDDKPMFIVENLDNLEMEIAVSEYSIGKVKLGQKAEISADIIGEDVAHGEIVSISPTGEEKGNGSTERVVPATIQIEGGSESGLIAGITARATIETGTAEDVFTVLQTALLQNSDGSISLASIDEVSKTVHMIPVKTGVESDLEVEVIPVEEGALTEGMLIATSPAGLTEGMTVMVN